MKQLAREVGADCIAVGHTANDQAETVLMWMLRGAGMAGLAGMPYAREDRIIRPLLAATREEVLAYLDHEGLTYRRDSSNEKSLYHRNRIRKELLPVIMRLAPAAVRVLQRQADLLREDEQYLAEVTGDLVRALVSRDSRGVQRLNRQAFIELPVALQRRLVRAVLRTYDEEGRASSVRVVESVRHLLLKGSERGPAVVEAGPRDPGSGVGCSLVQREGVARMRLLQSIGRARAWSLSVPSTVYWARTNQQIHVQHMTRRDVEQGGVASSAQRGRVRCRPVFGAASGSGLASRRSIFPSGDEGEK